MTLRTLSLAALALLPGWAMAQKGLSVPAPDTWWPQIHTRIALQSADIAPLTLHSALERPVRGTGSAALLGDYVFAAPRFGSFRASGGLVLGHAGWGSEAAWTQPYLGLGFTSAALLTGLSFTADLGLVSESPRALFGNQGAQAALREMRIGPVMQLGLKYAF